MAFNPDEYLQSSGNFNPDEFLGVTKEELKKKPVTPIGERFATGFKEAKSINHFWFNKTNQIVFLAKK